LTANPDFNDSDFGATKKTKKSRFGRF